MAGKFVRKEALLPYRPEDVWVALTDPRALAEWLMPNDFKPVKGHKFRFQVDPMLGCGNGITQCEVLEIDPPRRMVWSWKGPLKVVTPDSKGTTVTWTLTPEGTGTRLVLLHEGLEVLPLWARFSMGFGWGTMVKDWIGKVAANVSQGVFTPGAIPLNKRCYKTKTIPPDLVQ